MHRPTDGGPAFPCDPRMMRMEADGVTLTPIGHHGMSLRDWFAGQALIAATANHHTLESAARDAYAFADALLKARNPHA